MTTTPTYDKALTLCTFCPSLCLHTCPVSNAEARDSVSPWGKMSLARHVEQGLVKLDDEVAALLYKCLGCQACQQFCAHDNPVGPTLFEARARAVARGVTPFPLERFVHADWSADEGPIAQARDAERFETAPAFLLLPGHQTLRGAPDTLADTLALTERLGAEELCVGEASRLDVGYDLWAAGFHKEFAAVARRVQQALAASRQVVVLSAEALFLLRHIYPQFGAPIAADLVHVSEYLLSLMSGAVVERVRGRVAYHDSCHLARQLNLVAPPRELLRRVLEDAPVELAANGANTVCCGGTGCLPITSPATSREAAVAVIELALERGAERLVTFSTECVAQLRDAAGDRLEVTHGVTLCNQAIRGEG